MTQPQNTTIIKPYGYEGDWRTTHVEVSDRMEVWTVSTCGTAVTVSRRLLGSRRVQDMTRRLTGVYGKDHASRVCEVVALAERRPIQGVAA